MKIIRKPEFHITFDEYIILLELDGNFFILIYWKLE